MKTQKEFRRIARLVLWLCLLAYFTPVGAQNVTISPTTGKLIAAVTYPSEVGFQNGWSSMWRHDQLPLTFTVSDDNLLTQGGEIANPAGNIVVREDKLVVGGGIPRDLYMVISLPKGYRITGYRMVVLNNLNGLNVSGLQYGNITKTLYETGSDFNENQYKAKTDAMGPNNSNTEYVLTRTSATTTDMSNQLYFKMKRGANAFYGVTIKHLELFFTAQGDFVAPVAPFTQSNTGVSYVDVPFLTSRIDIGDIQPHTKNGKTFFSYDYRNVKDLTANNVLYEEGAVSGGAVAEVGSKSITAVYNGGKMYYGLGNKTYYVETPTQVTTQDGASNPIHYRIVGAKVNYALGTTTSSGSNIGFYITTQKNSKTYYLSEGGQFLENMPAVWQLVGNKITSNGKYIKYISLNTGYYLSVTTEESQAASMEIGSSSKSIRAIINGNRYYLNADESLSQPSFKSSVEERAYQQDVSQAGFTPAENFTLKVYGTDKNTVFQTIEVNSTTPNGSVAIPNLNNDAVKFEISGLAADRKALVTVDLTLEALNPYINRLDLVCKETSGQGRALTQQFTSNDFAVSGGKFIFYVPTDYNDNCKITFENLFSKYGDDTYYNGATNGHARYSLVKSEYWNNASSLYGGSYDPDADYKTKVLATVAGTQKFRFNNADELSNTNTSGGTKHYTEYPFSLSAYQTAGGTFEEVLFNLATSNHQKTAYLFACDETRYNIAPTTATEHRYYAYYIMDIELVRKTYTPNITWTEIYPQDKTLLVDENGQPMHKAQWGMTLKTTEAGPGTDEFGYLTVQQIVSAITTKGISADQILYIDGSPLLNIVNERLNVGQANETDRLAELHKTLGKNALVYLPEGETYNRNNFAYKTESGAFHSCNDIILTDKAPFYAPYEIQVDAANYAKYTREVTIPKYGNTLSDNFNATVILPFTIDLQDGKHKNRDDEFEFTLNTLSPTNALVYNKPVDDLAVAFNANFLPLNTERSEANKPYMVHVSARPAVTTGNKTSFVVQAYGSNIAKTPDNLVDFIFDGESATGTANSNPISFVNHGTYTGRIFERDQNKIFYFANGNFLCIKNLEPTTLKVLPFRAYFTYTGNVESLIKGMGIAFDETGELLGIDNLSDNRPDMAVVPGSGRIDVTVNADNRIVISGVDGTKVAQTTLKAGESRTFNVAAGIYVINGVKVIVR